MPRIPSPHEALAEHTLAVFQGRSAVERADIARAVTHHCKRIGCDESNTVAAVAWALRTGGDQLTAVRAGNTRAAQLLHRQAGPVNA
jgi:hypothetical protein